jgi:hypothetical protein
VGYGFADAPSWLVDTLALPATIGEFWMIGYLLAKGIRPAVTGTREEVTVAP